MIAHIKVQALQGGGDVISGAISITSWIIGYTKDIWLDKGEGREEKATTVGVLMIDLREEKPVLTKKPA